MENKKLFKAIADFQQEVPIIHKDTQGYGYSYADLPKIFEIINPLLKKHHLGFTQPIEGNGIKTIVFHTETGETLESVVHFPENAQLKGMNDFQVMGSAITYYRRYAISSILGLVTDKDTDANPPQKPTETKANNTKANSTAKANEPTKWLNVDSPEWENLKKSVGNGANFTLSQIKKKYKISKETEEALGSLNIF